MDVRNSHEIFEHLCEQPGCTTMVVHNNEPYCAQHSSLHPEGIDGYSARERAEAPELNEFKNALALDKQIQEDAEPKRRNVFE